MRVTVKLPLITWHHYEVVAASLEDAERKLMMADHLPLPDSVGDAEFDWEMMESEETE